MFQNFSGSPAQRKGLYFEKQALRFLKKRGLKLLQKNYHCAFGETDLIMSDGESIVFVEVRFRKRNDFGFAYETVNRRKRDRLVKTAQFYLLQRQLYSSINVRFDIVSISGGGRNPEFHWFRNAFPA